MSGSHGIWVALDLGSTASFSAHDSVGGDCELVRCGGCGLVRCSANCGVGMHGAPEVADREVMVQLLQPDPHWTDTIGL